MPKESTWPKKVKFVYNKPEGYQIFPVNGVFGGITPRGDLLCNFFYEYGDVPNIEEMQISKEGRLKPLKKPKKKVSFRRDLKVGISVNLEQAVSIANWILEKARAYEKSKERGKK